MITLETNCFEYQFKDNTWHYRLKGKKDWLEVMSLVNQELLTLAHKQQQQAEAQARALEALRQIALTIVKDVDNGEAAPAADSWGSPVYEVILGAEEIEALRAALRQAEEAEQC